MSFNISDENDDNLFLSNKLTARYLLRVTYVRCELLIHFYASRNAILRRNSHNVFVTLVPLASFISSSPRRGCCERLRRAGSLFRLCSLKLQFVHILPCLDCYHDDVAKICSFTFFQVGSLGKFLGMC